MLLQEKSMSTVMQDGLLAFFRSLLRNPRRLGRNQSALAKLSRLDPEDADGVARDVGLGSADLCTLAGRWPDSAELMSRLIAHLSLDEVKLHAENPQVLRNMQHTCALCAEKRQCERDLDQHAKDRNWKKYCLNAPTIRSLVSERYSKDKAHRAYRSRRA
jgi:hypothetical protein